MHVTYLCRCLSSLRESLPFVPDTYDQTLEALPSQPAASGNESQYTCDVRIRYSAACSYADGLGYGSRMHTHDHDGSKAPDGSPDSILSSEPKPLRSIGLLLHNPFCLLESYLIPHK
ncbi:hypothetical protein Tco_1368740 [Tanacetum coccineum]